MNYLEKRNTKWMIDWSMINYVQKNVFISRKFFVMNYKQFGKRSEMNKTIFTQKQKKNQKISLLSSIFFLSCFKTNKDKYNKSKDIKIIVYSISSLSIITARLNASCNEVKSNRVRISALTAWLIRCIRRYMPLRFENIRTASISPWRCRR